MFANGMNDLVVFVTVAREGNFTRAAARLGVSPSAVSQTMRGLEERLGVRLLTRTTRSVTRTEAGERLLNEIAPLLDQIEIHLNAVSDLRQRPSGTVRITADEFAARHVLWPKLQPVLETYPEVTVELITDYGLTDIVAERFDAGVRLGGIIDADMIAMPIGPDMRMVTVAAPAYLARHGSPQHPEELTEHRCINLRLPTHGGLYPWEFGSGENEFRVRVTGPLIMNSVLQILDACLAGVGIAQLPDTQVQSHLDDGSLQEILAEWSDPFPGYHLYYPSRRQQTAAFRVVLEHLRLER
ncbi:MAG: LysR family transcriptional regulator [Pseudomonas sp.]|jgi:DNA-binding transcriptional LysR family regulator|uniref:LysR family transcriptional regulator n=1 Tax=Stutzerimonas stutzeri KOS6 TaxID=1218352 RepID=A0A061JMA4_STUST|nr:LysR family transcriptional regulator [Stutzerimonas stutzeri]EWC39319.1 LysR family transcriptional regulator [Stutzerimonas stutzeri KOS6]MAF88586.1 LysR family transcriptional regulator [Pseudomonas sp.]MAK87830.1 LysR family transcriptional regulator [Pseudomonas sp.]HCH76515.1 LysR family transcriptional regulator [Pseudomonas sp.]|tara:strand:+ start:6945 stop:7838 length:894 start_codon:yes stop_codon:yes gene_type:complete